MMLHDHVWLSQRVRIPVIHDKKKKKTTQSSVVVSSDHKMFVYDAHDTSWITKRRKWREAMRKMMLSTQCHQSCPRTNRPCWVNSVSWFSSQIINYSSHTCAFHGMNRGSEIPSRVTGCFFDQNTTPLVVSIVSDMHKLLKVLYRYRSVTHGICGWSLITKRTRTHFFAFLVNASKLSTSVRRVELWTSTK